MSASEQPQTLEYAVPQTLGGGEVRRAFRQLLILSILSGLCVGVTFLTLTGNEWAALLHTVVFAATITVAVRSSLSLARLGPSLGGVYYRPAFVLDLIGAAGLVMIGIAPPAYHLAQMYGLANLSSIDNLGGTALGVAYALLAATTVRHLILYRFLAGACRQFQHHRMAKGLIVLGWFKMIYEAIWLGLCAMALILVVMRQSVNGLPMLEDSAIYCAFAGMFGAMGYGAVWIWMIIAHAQLFRLTRRAITSSRQDLQPKSG